MNEKLTSLLKLAKVVEDQCYYPAGRYSDGAPYTYRPVSYPLVDQAVRLLGGPDVLEQLIIDRQEIEPLADPDCANWMLWTILNEMEVSRERI